jgi:hypothetical protein
VGAACLVLAVSSPVLANAGYPMIIAIWPAAWLLFAPVLLVETVVAIRVLKSGFDNALGLSFFANLASTLVGIPVTWFLLAMVVAEGAQVWTPPDTAAGRIAEVTLGSPWLLPREAHPDHFAWMVPAAGLTLCIPFFFMSVVCEGLIARLLLGPTRRKEAWRWAWLANAASYVIIVGYVLVRLVSALSRDVGT